MEDPVRLNENTASYVGSGIDTSLSGSVLRKEGIKVGAVFAHMAVIGVGFL